MKSKKFIRLFGCLLIITLSVAFMGCGSSGVPSNNAAGQPAPSFADDDPDGASQASVNSNIDIVGSSENEPENSEQTLVGSTTQSTDASDYWQGSDFFDVIGYLEANGATDIANGIEELPVNGELQRCYWQTNCEISGWHLQINWMDGQIAFKNATLYCFCGQELNPADFITGNENGSPIPRQCISYLVSSLDYILSADSNTTVCPYCGINSDNPLAEVKVISESPFPHTHGFIQ